ncbi:MAG: DNA repair exonuclease [Acidobacteria bacterium]|nr:DNA repair exonuclease [Acidobacteriota bacterium]
MGIRLLFISDTHLGFDLPFKPRIERRRRGPDFFKNFEIALAPAYNKEVDAVIHGGDLFFRSKVPPKLVQMAFEPLIKVADLGVPVYLVPGNHERSAIPYRILAAHPNIHIFDHPKTYLLDLHGIKLALPGFPYVRHNIRTRFPQVLTETGWQNINADAYILCMHQCVEGAAIIMGNRLYMFRDNHDVIKISDIPARFTAVFSGHIHRFQVLTMNLKGRPVSVPIFYPGSIERTSFVEKDEPKGYLRLEISAQGAIENWQFNKLPARPMIQVELNAAGMNTGILSSFFSDFCSMNLTITLRDYRKEREGRPKWENDL